MYKMIAHDAKTDKPKSSGKYLICIKFYRLLDDAMVLCNFTDMEYSAKYDGWNLGEHGDRETEVVPDYWFDLPTYEEVQEMLKGEENDKD